MTSSTHDETHGHDHSHEHSNGHGAPASFSAAFAIGIALNLGFVVTEIVYGILSHSMALVADAGHNLSDVLGLALAWGAGSLARRKPSKRRTYGFRRSTILASLVNAATLLVVTGAIVWESARRFFEPQEVAGKTVIVVALIGVAVNGSSALLFMKGRKGDINVRSAFMHLASDAALALGVAVAGVVMMFTQWAWLDPLVSIVLSAVILVGTWSLLRGSLNLVLDAVPEGIDPDAVRAYLEALPGVIAIHDLHIWPMSTTEVALTAHLVMPTTTCEPRFLADVCREVDRRFKIEHSTLQVESSDAPDCKHAPEESL
jgi:cobalt-zinc-cadmium efflux system protein